MTESPSQNCDDFDLPIFYTVEQVAASIPVHPRTLYDWIEQGRFPAVHFGRSVRIEKSAYLEWIRNGGMTSVVIPAQRPKSFTRRRARAE